MTKAYSLDLRERIARFVDSGQSRHAAAAHFGVSVSFQAYVETQLPPTLSAGDVVILDNLAAHKSPEAEAAIRARGAWMLFRRPTVPISTQSRWPSRN
jgi:hypothetical protein